MTSPEKGLIKNPSKRFWAGLISFAGLLGTAIYAINQGENESVRYTMDAIQVSVFAWLLSLGGTDAITRAMKEWRLAKVGYEGDKDDD
jgi:hypothetical protein